jgi:hypothetical protein
MLSTTSFCYPSFSLLLYFITNQAQHFNYLPNTKPKPTDIIALSSTRQETVKKSLPLKKKMSNYNNKPLPPLPFNNRPLPPLPGPYPQSGGRFQQGPLYIVPDRSNVRPLTAANLRRGQRQYGAYRGQPIYTYNDAVTRPRVERWLNDVYGSDRYF